LDVTLLPGLDNYQHSAAVAQGAPERTHVDSDR